MLVVSVRERGKEEHPFTFDKDTIVIGRLRVNDVILPKRNISKKHATLELVGDEVRLTDMGSTNGTYLNGKRIMEPVAVVSTDKIFVGDYIIQIRQEDSRSAIDGKVAPLETPSPEAESRITMQDLDGSMLEKELEKLGVAPEDIGGPETQVIDPDQVPHMAPDPLPEPEPEAFLDEAPAVFEDSGDLEVEIEETGLGEDEELFEIPLEEEPEDEALPELGAEPSPAATPSTLADESLATTDMPAVSSVDVVQDLDDLDDEQEMDLGPIVTLLENPEFRDALILPDGSVIARDQDGKQIEDAPGFADADALADFAERVAGFEGVELGVVSRRLPGLDGWLSLVFPPVASEGIVGSLQRGAHAPVPISSLAKDGTLSSDHAKMFVQTFTAGGTVLITGRDLDAMAPLLAAGIGQLPGKPRYLALGPSVPRLGGDGDRERIEMGLDYAVEEPEAFMEALDLLQPRWIVAGACSGRSLLALLSVSVTVQVPLLATARLAEPARLKDLLTFADRREGSALGSKGVGRMLGLAAPLILEVDDGKVSGLFEVALDGDRVTIQERD